MIPFILSQTEGLLSFKDTPGAPSASPVGESYEHETGRGYFRIWVNETRPGQQTYMMEILWATEEIFRISHFIPATCIVFQLRGSMGYQSGDGREWIQHERSAMIISMSGEELNMHVCGNQVYRLILLPTLLKQITEAAETAPVDMDILNGDLEEPYLFAGSVIADRECLETLSLLFFEPSAAFMTGEIHQHLIRWILKQNRFQPKELSQKDAGWFYSQKDKLQEQSLKHLSSEQMLKAALISNKKLFQIRLRQLYGMTIAELVREYRMTAAISLLKNSENSNKLIAYRTGFRDVNYFTRVFGHYFGISPSAFRKMNL